MKLQMLTDKEVLPNRLTLEKGSLYEVVEIVQDTYKIKVPMKQKDKFWNVLVKDDEGELIDQGNRGLFVEVI